MVGLFIDTWGWLALRDKGERRHNETVAAFDKALASGSMVTTDYVLDETFTLLFRRLGRSQGQGIAGIHDRSNG